MQAVLISIQPGWCELIASGKKTVEVRKTMPLLPTPFKAYIYETKDPHYENLGYCWEKGKCFEHAVGKVIGEFIKTWVSFEPVVRPIRVLTLLHRVAPFVDKVKIGKLNYHPSDVKWGNFGRDIEAECKKLGIEYYIKDSLRAEMEKSE